MTRIEFNHRVDLTVINDDEIMDLTVKDLTPYQLDDLLYVTDDDRLKQFKDLRLQRTILEVLSRTPRHDMDKDPIGSESIEIDALARLVCVDLQPFEVTDDQELDDSQASKFKMGLHMVLFELRSMGIVNMHYDNDFNEEEVCLTKVGSVLCDILFRI